MYIEFPIPINSTRDQNRKRNYTIIHDVDKHIQKKIKNKIEEPRTVKNDYMIKDHSSVKYATLYNRAYAQHIGEGTSRKHQIQCLKGHYLQCICAYNGWELPFVRTPCVRSLSFVGTHCVQGAAVCTYTLRTGGRPQFCEAYITLD